MPAALADLPNLQTLDLSSNGLSLSFNAPLNVRQLLYQVCIAVGSVLVLGMVILAPTIRRRRRLLLGAHKPSAGTDRVTGPAAAMMLRFWGAIDRMFDDGSQLMDPAMARLKDYDLVFPRGGASPRVGKARRLRALLLLQACLEIADVATDTNWIIFLVTTRAPFISYAPHPPGLVSVYTIHYTVVANGSAPNLAWDRTQLQSSAGNRLRFVNQVPLGQARAPYAGGGNTPADAAFLASNGIKSCVLPTLFYDMPKVAAYMQTGRSAAQSALEPFTSSFDDIWPDATGTFTALQPFVVLACGQFGPDGQPPVCPAVLPRASCDVLNSLFIASMLIYGLTILLLAAKLYQVLTQP